MRGCGDKMSTPGAFRFFELFLFISIYNNLQVIIDILLDILMGKFLAHVCLTRNEKYYFSKGPM